MVICENGELFGFGSSKYCQNGNIKTEEDLLTPREIMLEENLKAIQVSCGWIHSAVLVVEKQENLEETKIQVKKKTTKDLLGNFSVLPKYVFLIVLSNLDAVSLCQLCPVNSHFNTICKVNYSLFYFYLIYLFYF